MKSSLVFLTSAKWYLRSGRAFFWNCLRFWLTKILRSWNKSIIWVSIVFFQWQYFYYKTFFDQIIKFVLLKTFYRSFKGIKSWKMVCLFIEFSSILKRKVKSKRRDKINFLEQFFDLSDLIWIIFYFQFSFNCYILPWREAL